MSWPPLAHGRIVCKTCGVVVAQCRCAKGCETVGTVPYCAKCTCSKVDQDGGVCMLPAHHDASMNATPHEFTYDVKVHRTIGNTTFGVQRQRESWFVVTRQNGGEFTTHCGPYSDGLQAEWWIDQLRVP